MDSRHPGLVALGQLVRQLRLANGKMLQSALANAVRCAESTLSEIENGKEWPSRDLLAECDRALSTNGALVAYYDTIRDLRFPTWFLPWVPEEKRATFIRSYQGDIVDGLLQTPAYAGVMLDDADLAARLDRQELLTRTDPPPPSLAVVLDESVLYRLVGTPQIMREQLQHLVEVASERIMLHVVPSVAHKGVTGAFVLATVENGTIGYTESAVRGMVVTNRDDVEHLNVSWELIRSQAFPMGMSIDLIKKVAEEKWS